MPRYSPERLKKGKNLSKFINPNKSRKQQIAAKAGNIKPYEALADDDDVQITEMSVA